MKRIFSKILVLFLFISASVFPQKFNASVDKTTLGQNERFRLYFTFDGEDMNAVRNFRAPQIVGLRIISGPNQSTNMQIINGKVSASLTYTYILQTLKLGKYTIGAASLEYKGKVYRTQPVDLNVVKSGSGKQNVGGVSNEELAKNVFILAIPNKKTVYRGEQVTVEYKLYTKTNISSPQISKLPQYNGFWAEELNMSNNIRFNIEMYKGQRYRVASIKKVALFPTKSGSLKVTPFELNVPVIIKKRKSSRDIFDSFFNDSFFGRTETVDYLAKSNQISIKVKPLPKSGVPKSFDGNVGRFNLQASIDKKQVKMNEALTIKVSLSGVGNIGLLKLPQLIIPTGFEKYDPKTKDNISKKNIITGAKTAEYVIIPRIPGKKQIPAIEFSYFDPKLKKYIEKKAGPFEINVEAGNEKIISDISGLTKEEVTFLSRDIRFIKTGQPEFIEKGTTGNLPVWFWYSIIVPMVLFVSFIGLRRRQAKISGNVSLLKFKKAEKAAKKSLKKAKKELESGSIVNFYSEIAAALFGYLEDKLRIQKSDFTLNKARTELEQINVEHGLIEQVGKISERCEFARFAPSSGDTAGENEFYNETFKLIVTLDDAIDMAKINK